MMATYIHYTHEFLDKIGQDSKKDLIIGKIEDLRSYEKPENLNSVDPYSKGLLVLKFIKAYTCRIIIQPVWMTINGESIHVLFIRDFVSKKRFDYLWGNVIHPLLRNGEWLEKYPLPQHEYTTFESNYISNLASQDSRRPQLPASLSDWLRDFRITLNFDVYETESWVLFSNDRTNGLLEKHILFFRDTLKVILTKTRNDTIKVSCINEEGRVFKAIYEPFNIGMIYSDFEEVNGKRIVVLYDGAHIKDQEARWSAALERLKKNENTVEGNLLQISKEAFRAYPKWIVTNESEDLWVSIQRYEGTHNLSLLPEQVMFLNNFKFPAYINGQAGSGKSTMLYYLFANVYFFKCMGEQMEGDIIFLTENDHLLEHTSQSIIGLLSSNPEFSIGFTIEERNNVRKHFLSFKDYLLGILPEEERATLDSYKYLDFARFKEQFLSSTYISKKFSPEEVWFVISTYIYGYDEYKIIDSGEKYNQDIPSKFRIVDNDNFQAIVQNYLSFYTKLLEEGWWDKTFLVRKIRKTYPSRLPKQYAVVFCDEAQDFTRIELRLIIQSSIFTSYDLEGTEQIPIVFAGDALQTVSPTGFSDVRLHQMYFDAFGESNFTYDKIRSTYNPSFNYRSLQPIVRLANVVQFYRKETLMEDIFIRQESKRGAANATLPILHEKEWLLKSENRELFEKKFRYKSFIVPVDLKEEDVYIKTEELLQNNIFTDIKSSIDAKGAEYSQVVVYGFGDYFLTEFGMLGWEKEDSDFKKRFFFNKLYVAVTRAQNELVIIDGKNAIDNFWIPLLTVPAGVESWEKYSDVDDVLPMRPGSGLSNIQDSTPDDALQNATLDMEQGINDMNVARLVVASNVFLMLGKIEEANCCLGYKEQIRRRWVEAGNHFIKAGKQEEAANAFLQAKQWDRLLNDLKGYSGNKQEVRILISRLMKNGVWEKDELSRIYDLRNALSEVTAQIIWYPEYCEKLITYASGIVNAEDKRELAFILESIVKEEDSTLWRLIGQLYFDTKQFNNAIDAWSRIINNQADPDYFPDYIKAHIEKSKDEQSIADELLWVGRLVRNNISKGERITLAKRMRKAYQENQDEINDSDFKWELYTHIYSALVLLGEIDQITEIGSFVESNASDIGQLLSLYSFLIHNSADERIAILGKERWIKLKFHSLRSIIQDTPKLLIICNDEFAKQNFPFADSNNPWELFEINQVPEKPMPISLVPDDHFKSIVIKNYRRFPSLEISNLGQINLIVGNNNSGKTSFLEALLFSPDPDICFRNFLYCYQQRNNNAEQENAKTFFTNLINKDATPREIQFVIKNGRRYWSYLLRNPSSNELTEGQISDNLDGRQFLAIKESQSKIKISKHIDVAISDSKDAQILKDISFVPFGKGYTEKLSSVYYNEIGIKRTLRSDFVNQMKIFIPEIIDIAINPDTNHIVIEAGINGHENQYSLHDFGEGANKLFRILVQLHASKNKRLMIDEIDAGVHYSRLQEFWKIIISIALEYNVQLFVTTHNDECLKAYADAVSDERFANFRDRVRVVTLEYHISKQEVIPIVRDYANIEFANDQNIELRGRIL